MLYVKCPHCDGIAEIESVNCAIFRHATFKGTNQPIPPHSPLHDCERFLRESMVYGCTKPFRLVKNANNEYDAIKCDYI